MTLALAAALAKQSLDRQMIHIQHFDCWSERVDICYSKVSCVYVYIFVLVHALKSLPFFGYIDLQRFLLHVKLFKIINMHRQHIIHDKYLDRGTTNQTFVSNSGSCCAAAAAALGGKWFFLPGNAIPAREWHPPSLFSKT